MKKIVTNTILVLFSLSLILVAIEIVLRAFFPLYMTGYIGAYQYDPVLGVRLKDDSHFLKLTDYQQEIFTNKIGSVNFQDTFSGYEKLIFAIGDSYTQGIGIPPDAAYPFQLDMMLNLQNDSYQKNYAVINLGLSAFGTEQEILSLQRYQKFLGNPDVILYLGSSNDFSDDALFEAGYRHKHLVDGNPYWGKLLLPLQWFSNNTEIGKRLKFIRGYFKHQSYINPDTVEPARSPTTSATVAELQKDKLDRLLNAANNMGAILIVSWAELPSDAAISSYQWLYQWARENKVAFADWHSPYQSIQQNIPRLPGRNLHSGGHYRTWVNNIIARSYLEKIKTH